MDMALTQGFRNHLNFCSKRNYKLKIVMNIWAVGLNYYMLGSDTMEITAERERAKERDQYNKKRKESLPHTHTHTAHSNLPSADRHNTNTHTRPTCRVCSIK